VGVEGEFRSGRARDFVHAKVLPGLTPKFDPTLDGLMDSAIKGAVPVYFAAVPLALCLPFDVEYRADLHQVGAAAIDRAFQQACAGNFKRMLVYPRGI